MWPKILIALFLFLIFFTDHALSQEEEKEEIIEEFKHFRISPLIGHTFIQLREDASNTPVASWGLDLEYWINHTWGIGLHNDFEIESFLVEQTDMELIERKFPLVITLDALYNPWRELVIVLGPGIEFDPGKSFSVFRIGLEYEFQMHNHWDFSPIFFYDTRINGFDTWSVAVGVGKRF